MDIYLHDPNEMPLPPEEVRIRALRADPWPDGLRVRIYVEVDPFQKRPSVDVDIMEPSGDVVAHTTVIESMIRKMEFNMHLRPARSNGIYTVSAVLFYSDPIPEPGNDPDMQAEPIQVPKTNTVDHAETKFSV